MNLRVRGSVMVKVIASGLVKDRVPGNILAICCRGKDRGRNSVRYRVWNSQAESQRCGYSQGYATSLDGRLCAWDNTS